MTMPLGTILNKLEISQRDLAREAEISLGVVNRLVAGGQWPKRKPMEACRRICDSLKAKGAKASWLKGIEQSVQDLNKAALATADNSAKAIPNQFRKNIMEDSMLLNFTPMTQATLSFFKLRRNPFVDDVQCLEDVYMSKDYGYVRAILEDAMRGRLFVAVIGESGAGKSTLVEAFEEKSKANPDYIIIKPYVLAMEGNDVKGKTLKSSQIVECIVRTLDPDATLRSTPQARFKQVHDLLKASHLAGRRHLLVIEEAHCLPVATLKHLKRFRELKDGLSCLLGIALIGQPELGLRLSSQNPEVREVAQRCEIVTLPPLNNHLSKYLEHKFERVGAKLADVLADDAVDAIRARLTHLPRGGRKQDAVSMCFPLVVGNLLTRAMNEAAATAYGKVDAHVIAGC